MCMRADSMCCYEDHTRPANGSAGHVIYECIHLYHPIQLLLCLYVRIVDRPQNKTLGNMFTCKVHMNVHLHLMWSANSSHAA